MRAGIRGKGRPFEKGNTIGRHGRRKRNPTVTQLCRDASPEAVETLIKIMRDERAPHGVRAHCADKIIERGWGKAPAHNTVEIQHNVRVTDLSDDQLLRIIAGETLQSVLAVPSRSSIAPPLGVSRGPLLEAQAVEVAPEPSAGSTITRPWSSSSPAPKAEANTTWVEPRFEIDVATRRSRAMGCYGTQRSRGWCGELRQHPPRLLAPTNEPTFAIRGRFWVYQKTLATMHVAASGKSGISERLGIVSITTCFLI